MPRRRMLRDMLMGNYRMMPDARARGRMMGREDYNYGSGDYGHENPEYSRYSDSRSSQMDYARGRRDYGMGRQYDGHYEPIEIMGRFNGYYGGAEDYARNMRGQDYNYSRDYGYNMPYNDYRDYAGDYGESLTKDELEEWKMKLMREVEDKDKPFLTKDAIMQKAKQMGAEMKDYNEDELLISVLMAYADYCKAIKPYVGSNIDIYIALGKAWLEDKDVSVKGSEKLAIYYDCIVSNM